MLRMMHSLKGYTLAARDDAFGKVKDFLFDEEDWTIRYMVADTGNWLPGRTVLISPVVLERPDWASGTFLVNLSRADIERAPPLESDAPVSRQYEMDWHDTMGYPYYWGGSMPWGWVTTPWDILKAKRVRSEEEGSEPEDQNRVLRSAEEVRKYRVDANNGEIGHVDDFIMDDETLAIRYLVIDTHNWLPGRKVLLAPGWIDGIDWNLHQVSTTLSRESVKNSPDFNPAVAVNRDYEGILYDYYGRPAYWEVAPADQRQRK